MDLIDPRTFLIVANLLGMLCALVLWVQAKSFPGDIHGLRDWALAVVLIGAVMVLIVWPRCSSTGCSGMWIRPAAKIRVPLRD